MAEQEIGRGDRINIDDSVMGIYRALVDEKSKEDAPFNTYRDVFLAAACLGFENGRRETLPTNKKTQIRIDIFRDDGLAVMQAIAIAETGNVEVLHDLGRVLTIAEEYAHSGIYELKARLLDERGRPLWNLVGLVAQ